MKGNLLRISMCALGILPGRFVIAARQQRGANPFLRDVAFFSPCVSIFPTFPFDFFFTPRVCRTARGRGGARGARLIVVCARAMRYSYRYNVIADTAGTEAAFPLPPLPLPRPSALARRDI